MRLHHLRNITVWSHIQLSFNSSPLFSAGGKAIWCVQDECQWQGCHNVEGGGGYYGKALLLVVFVWSDFTVPRKMAVTWPSFDTRIVLGPIGTGHMHCQTFKCGTRWRKRRLNQMNVRETNQFMIQMNLPAGLRVARHHHIRQIGICVWLQLSWIRSSSNYMHGGIKMPLSANQTGANGTTQHKGGKRREINKLDAWAANRATRFIWISPSLTDEEERIAKDTWKNEEPKQADCIFRLNHRLSPNVIFFSRLRLQWEM